MPFLPQSGIKTAVPPMDLTPLQPRSTIMPSGLLPIKDSDAQDARLAYAVAETIKRMGFALRPVCE